MRMPFHIVMYKTFSAQRARVRPFLTSIGLSPGQPKVLTLLYTAGSRNQKELADACEIDPATMSKLLCGMERAGLISREVMESNKRAVRVCITAKGRRLYEQVAGHMDEVEAGALAGFSGEERRLFREYLCRMYRNLTGNDMEKGGLSDGEKDCL